MRRAPTTEAEPISEYTRRSKQRQESARAATRQARTPAARHYALRAVRPSPARTEAPEPTAWLPLPDTDTLPSIEEMLTPQNLVDSGQTIAISAAVQALLEPTVAPLEVPDTNPGDSIAATYHARRTASARVRSIRVQSSVGARRAARLAKRRRRLALTGIVGGTIVAFLLAMVGVVLTGQRQVRLDLDGAAQSISTRSVTVAELLKERGIALAGDDKVTPALNASLDDGMRILVRRAHDVVIDLDGTTTTVRTTAATLGELRAERNIPEELVAAEPASAIDFTKPVLFRTPHSVTVAVDGTETKLVTTALTVRELLPVAGVTLGGNDDVTPGLDTRLANDLTVTVTRLADDQRTELRPIPFATQERPDASLPAGTRKVVQEGQAGSQRLTYRLNMRNGVVVSEQLISTVTVQAPRTRIVAVGRANAGSSEAPTPVRGSGQGSETGQATWYDYTPGTCAHKTLPKGTVVTVINLGTGASTTCVVADRGPYAAGRIIDLTPGVFARLAPLSSGVISVRIEW